MSRARLTFAFVVILILSAARLDAAWITIGWDPNTESDVSGYIVAYGTASRRDDAMVNVGAATSWTFSTASPGQRYYFRVYAYNSAGLRSPSSTEVTALVASTDTTGPISLDKSALNFVAIKNGVRVSTVYSGSQAVVVTSNTGTATTWTAASSTGWLSVTPATGGGTGTFTVSLRAASLPTAGVYSASITVKGGGVTLALPVSLEVKAPSAARAPLGSFDTPADGASGVHGAVPVTGWALDDVEVSKVQIFRDPVPGEAGQIYLGDATFIGGARPDVEAGFGTWPLNDRAGWGFMLLTNMLPDIEAGTAAGGNGTFRLHAYALDVDGNTTKLGTKTIIVSNRNATEPFGTIDTPTQGGVVSGSAFVNFGWAISPLARIPENGSTITVLIDGVAVGSPSYGYYRSDIAGAFPTYANTGGAIGYHVIDTTKLANGMHTIAWVAVDDQGHSSGLGSRFFSVLNEGASAAATMPSATVETTAAVEATAPATQRVEVMSELPVENASAELTRTAGTSGPETLVPDWKGSIAVHVAEAEPIELHLATDYMQATGGTYEGFMVSNGDMRPLPAGSTLDVATGTFHWQPGAGFVGAYELLFVRTLPEGAKTRIPVRVTITPPFDAVRADGDSRP